MQGKEGIYKFEVTQPHKAPEGATNVSTKVSFELDLHGLVRCNGVVHNHKIEVEEPVTEPAAAKPAEDVEMKDAPAEGAPAAAGENGDASNMDADDSAAEAPKTVKKVKKVRQPAADCLSGRHDSAAAWNSGKTSCEKVTRAGEQGRQV